MKIFPFSITIIFIALFTCTQNVYSANELFSSIASGNWNSTTTWVMSTNGGGTWFAATSIPNDTSGTITIRNPNTVTVTVSTTANQMVIDSGGVLKINLGIILTIPDGSGTDITMSLGSILNGPGTVKTQNTVSLNLRGGSAFNANLNVNTGTTYAYDQTSPYDGSLYGNLTVDAGATLNCGDASGRHLFMYGDVVNNGTITASSSGGSYSINGPTLVNNGTLTTDGSAYMDSTTSISGSGIFNPANTYISGNVTLLNNITYSPSYIVLYSGGVLNPNGKTLTITSGTFEVQSGTTVTSPGTVKTQNTVSLNLRGGSALNAILNVNTGTTYAYDHSSPYEGSLYGDLVVDAGATLNTGNIYGRQLSMYGDVIINGTITASSTGGSYSINGPTLVNNGTVTGIGSAYMDSTTSISGSGIFNPANTYISGNVTLLNNITYTPTYIGLYSGGVLNPNGKTLTITSGTFEVQSGTTVTSPGTVKTQNTVSLNLRGGSAFNANLNVNTGTTYAYDQISPYDGSLYGNLTVDAGATLNCGNASGRHLFMYGNVVNNGTITASHSSGSYSINGPTLVNNGTLTAAGSAYMDSTTSISGSGIFNPTNTYISGNVTLLNNITYSPSYIRLYSGGVLNPNGKTLTITSGTFEVQSGTSVTSPGTVKTQNTVSLNLRGGTAFNANLNVNTGTTYAYDQITPYYGSLYGNLTIDAGATINGGNISGRALLIYGNTTNNGTLTASSTGGSIIVKCPVFVNNGVVNTSGSFSFDSTTAFSGTGSFLTHADFTAKANVTLTGTHQMQSITINTAGIFNITNSWLKLKASNPIVNSGTFTTTNSTVEFNSNVLQTISTAGITYSKLRSNNSAGTNLAGNVTVNDSLIIQLGTLDLNGKVLTVSSTGTLLESPGNVVKGTAGYLTTTRSINAPSSLNVAGFGAILTSTSNLGSTEIRRGHAVQTGGSIKRYFDITPTNNSGLNATLKFKFDESELNLRPESTLKLIKSTNAGVNWINMGGTVNTSLNEITISGLSSFSRWSADSSGVNGIINFAIQGYYNPSTNRLNMEDTVRIYLRQTSPPYSIADSCLTLLDSALLKAACVFSNAVSGTYYIQIKHRNALETWSKYGGESYIAGNTLNYDFMSSAANAFGNNQIQVDAAPVRYAIYSGDVFQDGIIDGSDGNLVDNAASIFETGYIVSDIDGDRVVDGSDASIVDNNAANFVSVALP